MSAHSVGRVALKGRFIVVASVAGFAALGVCLNIFTPSVYRATVRLEIPRPADRSPWTGQSVVGGSYQSENVALYTAAELISSRMLLRQLAADLDDTPFGPELVRAAAGGSLPGLAAQLRGVGLSTEEAHGASEAVAAASSTSDPHLLETEIDWLQEIVSVQPVRDTRLVDIKVEYTSPQGARAIADRLAGLFVRYLSEKSAADDTSGLAYLENQIVQVRKGIEASENLLYEPGRTSLASMRSRVAQLNETIANLNAAYAKARTDRLGVGARLARLRSFAPDRADAWIHEPIESETLDALRRDLLSCQMRLAAARSVYRDKHPKLIAIESECASLQTRIREELPGAIANLAGEQSVLAAREADLERALAQTEAELGTADEQVQRRSLVEGELKANQDLYARLLAKVQDERIEGQMRSRPAEIVDPATVDPNPVRPRKVLNLAVCLVAGLLVGFGGALLAPPHRPAIEDPRVLEEQLELPVVAVYSGKA